MKLQKECLNSNGDFQQCCSVAKCDAAVAVLKVLPFTSSSPAPLLDL